jgi:cobalt-zinc-cadmium efflux system outer membrane protein
LNVVKMLAHCALSGLSALCLLVPVKVQAQNTAVKLPRRLTLAEAEDLLIQRNLGVTAARYQVEASRAARLIASYKPNPVVTVGMEQIPFYSPLAGSFPRFFATNPDAGANPVWTFRVDKIWERGGKRELRMEQADFQMKASEAQMLDAIRTQIFQMRQAFAAAALARENLVLATATEQQYEQTERLTAIKVDQGDLPGVEVYRVQAGRLQYQQAVLQARTAYVQATLDVCYLLGSSARDVAPQGPARIEPAANVGASKQMLESLHDAPLDIIFTFDEGPVLMSLAALRDLALTARPDVAVARNNGEAAGRGVLLAKAQRTRDFDLAYEYQRTGSDHTAGVVFQVPLFVYNNQRAALAQAEAQRRSAEALAKQAELQAIADVEKAYQAYLSSRHVLDLYSSQNLTQVEKLRSIAAFSYQEGTVSLFELLDAQRAYNQALTAYNQARADYQLSLWQLEHAVGRPLR